MRVRFLNPRDSRAFESDVDPETTGQRCIDGLIDAEFIQRAPEDRPYQLVVTRTNRQCLPAMTMQEAGVIEDDAIAVHQAERGALKPDN